MRRRAIERTKTGLLSIPAGNSVLNGFNHRPASTLFPTSREGSCFPISRARSAFTLPYCRLTQHYAVLCAVCPLMFFNYCLLRKQVACTSRRICHALASVAWGTRMRVGKQVGSSLGDLLGRLLAVMRVALGPIREMLQYMGRDSRLQLGRYFNGALSICALRSANAPTPRLPAHSKPSIPYMESAIRISDPLGSSRNRSNIPRPASDIYFLGASCRILEPSIAQLAVFAVTWVARVERK